MNYDNETLTNDAIKAGLITEEEREEFLGTLDALDDIEWDLSDELTLLDGKGNTVDANEPYYVELSDLVSDIYKGFDTSSSPQDFHRNWIKLKGLIERMNSVENKIYKYLMLNHVGKDNRILGNKLCAMFNIKLTSVLREIIANIRLNPLYKYLIGAMPTDNGGYWIVDNVEDMKRAIISMEGRAVKMFDVARQMRNKRIIGEKE